MFACSPRWRASGFLARSSLPRPRWGLILICRVHLQTSNYGSVAHLLLATLLIYETSHSLTRTIHSIQGAVVSDVDYISRMASPVPCAGLSTRVIRLA